MMVYCDYIADRIKGALDLEVQAYPETTLVGKVGPVKMDLHPTEGYFQSTMKTIEITDINKKKYKITVEEI